MNDEINDEMIKDRCFNLLKESIVTALIVGVKPTGDAKKTNEEIIKKINE